MSHKTGHQDKVMEYGLKFLFSKSYPLVMDSNSCLLKEILCPQVEGLIVPFLCLSDLRIASRFYNALSII